MKKLLVLLTAVCAVSVLAESVNLYECGFEQGEGFDLGSIVGVNNWVVHYGSGTMTAIDTDAAEGTQCAKIEGAAYSSFRNSFDISGVYEANYNGALLDVYCYVKTLENADNTLDVKFQALTGSETGELEIMEYQQAKNGSHWFVFGRENGDNPSWWGYVDAAPWHKVGGIIDPKTKTIKKLYIDDKEYTPETAGETMYYKSYAKPKIGSYPNSLRIMNAGLIDGFHVDVIPEPAIFGLLALLGLFFARKQR